MDLSVSPISRFVAAARVGTSWAFSDSGAWDFDEQLLVKDADAFGVAAEHLEQSVFDVGQGGDIAEIDGMERRILRRVGHHPPHKVAQQQMGVNFLDDTGRGVAAEVLNVQAVLPFSIDRLDLPSAMVQINEFAVEMNLRIEQ